MNFKIEEFELTTDFPDTPHQKGSNKSYGEPHLVRIQEYDSIGKRGNSSTTFNILIPCTETFENGTESYWLDKNESPYFDQSDSGPYDLVPMEWIEFSKVPNSLKEMLNIFSPSKSDWEWMEVAESG